MPRAAKLKLTAKQTKVLHEEDIAHFDSPIREMDAASLREHFSTKRSKRINVARLVKNILWQVYEQIETKQRPTLDGNLRSLWYSDVKPVLSRAGALKDTDAGYSLLSDLLVHLVTQDLLHYRSFDFTDERYDDRRIGKKRRHVLLASEKRGHWRWLKRMQEAHDVTIIALGGQPSLMSSEYFVAEMKKAKVNLTKTLPMFTVVDYDPAGESIAKSFIRQLKCFGVCKVKRIDLIKPAYMTKAQVELSCYRLSGMKREQLQAARWVRLTGGVNGKAYGIEADAMTTEQLTEVFETNLRKLRL
jgi:hypothetical protein